MTRLPSSIVAFLLLAVLVRGQPFSLSANPSTFNPSASGTVTFTLSYTGTLAANTATLGFELVGPTGWTFLSNQAAPAGSFLAAPSPGDSSTSEFPWNWGWNNGATTISGLSFTTTLSYDATQLAPGLQTFDLKGYEGISLVNTSSVSVGSAIPEPSTYASIAGLGVLCAAVWRRRRLRGASQ